MKFELYRSGIVRKEWRWRLRARNGRIIATSGEGYANRGDCINAIHLVKVRAAETPIVGPDGALV